MRSRRQAAVQHQAVEDVHGLLQLPARGRHRGRKDLLHARGPEPRAAKHGADQADHASHRCVSAPSAATTAAIAYVPHRTSLRPRVPRLPLSNVWGKGSRLCVRSLLHPHHLRLSNREHAPHPPRAATLAHPRQTSRTRACCATCCGPTRTRTSWAGARTTAACPSPSGRTWSPSSCAGTTSTSSAGHTRCVTRATHHTRRGGGASSPSVHA